MDKDVSNYKSAHVQVVSLIYTHIYSGNLKTTKQASFVSLWMQGVIMDRQIKCPSIWILYFFPFAYPLEKQMGDNRRWILRAQQWSTLGCYDSTRLGSKWIVFKRITCPPPSRMPHS